MKAVRFGNFSISLVAKTFEDKTSTVKQFYSTYIDILGVKWRVSIQNEENKFFGIYLHREVKEK